MNPFFSSQLGKAKYLVKKVRPRNRVANEINARNELCLYYHIKLLWHASKTLKHVLNSDQCIGNFFRNTINT